jgi:predicted transposase/invertase (TIGR01784 family)
LANPYQVPKIAELKDTVPDIRATDQDGQHFIVEMQAQKDATFAKRSLYDTAKSYAATGLSEADIKQLLSDAP